MADQNAEEPGESQDNFIVKYFKDFSVLKETKREYWGLQVVNMLDCIAYFAMFNIAVVTLSRDFGFTDVGAGRVFFWFSGITTIFLFFSGVVTDWLGIKKALYLAIFGLLIGRAGIVVVQYMDEPARMNEQTQLSALYDGKGIPFVDGQPDLAITARDGTAFVVDLSGSETISDLLGRINSATGNDGRVEASIAPGWTSLRLEDKSEVDEDAEEVFELAVAPTEANPDAAERLQLVKERKPLVGAETEAENPEDEVAGDEVEEEKEEKKKSSPILDGRRIISDFEGVPVTDMNQGRGLMGGTTLEVTDLLGQKMTVTGLDQAGTIRELLEMLQKVAEEQPANVEFSLNAAGNGFRVRDLNRDEKGFELTEGDLIVEGDAADPLQILSTIDDGAGGTIAGSSLVLNRLRSWLTWGLLVFMAPFMAMIQTVFQAGNRRFTTKRSRGAGFNLWYLFMNVGAAAAGFAIDIIYLKLGLPHFHVFTLGVGTGVLCLVAAFFLIKSADQLRSPDEEAEEEAKEKAEEKPEKKSMGPLEITKAVLSEPIFWRFTVLISLLLGVRAVFLYLSLLFPKYWYRVIGPDAEVGTMQAANPVIVIFGLILLIPVLERFNVYKMLVTGALITSISMFVPALPMMFGFDIVTWTYITTFVFLLILTVGELIWSPRLYEYTAAIAPEGQEATYLGLSMVPYFLAKSVVTWFSGAMLMRWCPESSAGEPNVGERIASGELGFWESPYAMWLILGIVALAGTIAAILGKGWFTKGAHFDTNAGKESH